MTMEKPNITEGEWIERYPDIISKYQVLATVHIPNDTSTTGFSDKANCKAISAVPEMIDDLVAIYDLLDRMEGLSGKYDEDIHFEKKSIKETLKKAGVEF